MQPKFYPYTLAPYYSTLDGFFVSTIFNEGAYLTSSIFHKALKDGMWIIDISLQIGQGAMVLPSFFYFLLIY